MAEEARTPEKVRTELRLILTRFRDDLDPKIEKRIKKISEKPGRSKLSTNIALTLQQIKGTHKETLILREHLVDALTALGDKAVPELVKYFKSDESAGVRGHILTKLTELKSPEGIVLAEDTLKDNPHTEARAAAADLLAGLGGRGQTDTLLAALTDPSISVRFRVSDALGKILKTFFVFHPTLDGRWQLVERKKSTSVSEFIKPLGGRIHGVDLGGGSGGFARALSRNLSEAYPAARIKIEVFDTNEKKLEEAREMGVIAWELDYLTTPINQRPYNLITLNNPPVRDRPFRDHQVPVDKREAENIAATLRDAGGGCFVLADNLLVMGFLGEAVKNLRNQGLYVAYHTWPADYPKSRQYPSYPHLAVASTDTKKSTLPHDSLNTGELRKILQEKTIP